MTDTLQITILGLSITSSWGNGHATTYRSLVRGLAERGHSVVFLERDVPWYRENRDLPQPPFTTTHLYGSLEELESEHLDAISNADLVIVGSFVPDGLSIGSWVCSVSRGVTAFYDIDTPVTLAKFASGQCDYIDPALIRRYDCYLSFTGGKVLRQLEQQWGSPLARALYCSVDPDQYAPQPTVPQYDLGYLGTYSPDRQPPLERLLLDPARQWNEGRFVVAGPQYPAETAWPANVDRIEHLPPRDHCGFYCDQRFTLNVTRAEMIRTGYSPSVRLFEAAACGVPLISDWWEGLGTFFQPGREILISRSAGETLSYLQNLDEATRRQIGTAARSRVLAEHTSERRAEELEAIYAEALQRSFRNRRGRPEVLQKHQHQPV